MNETKLKEMHNLSYRNKPVIKKSNLCGCFYCRRTFKPSDIVEWCDKNGDTALCPRCGIDSVLPLDDTIDNTELLEKMSIHWFNLKYNEDGNLVHDWVK